MKKKIYIVGISVICAIVVTVIVVCTALYLPRIISGSKRVAYIERIDPHQAYLVDRVIDGDTVVVRIDGHDVTTRLLGIDTPEVVDPRKSPQCYGREASDQAKKLLSGKYVYLELDPLKSVYDKYHRVLTYLYLSDERGTSSARSTLYNQLMIEQGFAREYTFSHEPYRYQSDFIAAEGRARAGGLGLWNKETCNGGRNTL
jgi:micrococcal nuclease